MEQRKDRRAWYLYDIGNTIIEFTIALHLTQWLVIDLEVPSRGFALAFAASSCLVAFSGPYIGFFADKNNRRLEWFLWSSLAAVFFVGSLSLIHGNGPTFVLIALLIAMAGNYFFHTANILYNAGLMNAAQGGSVVSVSAMGTGLSYIGAGLGIAIIELVVSGGVWNSIEGHHTAFGAAAIFFFLCTVPSLRTPRLWNRNSEYLNTVAKTHSWIIPWKRIKIIAGTGPFLFGFFSLSAAITGLSLYLPLHIRFSMSNIQNPTSIMAVAVLFAASGAMSIARISKLRANYNHTLLVALGIWIVLILILAFSKFYFLTISVICIQAFFAGILLPTLRAVFAMSFPEGDQGMAFGFYGFSQKLAAGLGALIWPWLNADVASSGSTRDGIIGLSVLALISIPFFLRWHFTNLQKKTGAD